MYKSIAYRDVIADHDEDTRKRFDLIGKLSRGFTVEHKTVMEIDALLFEQLRLEGQSTSNVESTQSKPLKSSQKAKEGEYCRVTAFRKLKLVFRDLFEALKNQNPQSSSMDDLRALVKK